MKLFLTVVLAVTAFAETHQFTPTKFYNTFSGAHPPVLHIKPGDHVITSTIDARGFDAPLLTARATGVQVDVPVMF